MQDKAISQFHKAIYKIRLRCIHNIHRLITGVCVCVCVYCLGFVLGTTVNQVAVTIKSKDVTSHPNQKIGQDVRLLLQGYTTTMHLHV